MNKTAIITVVIILAGISGLFFLNKNKTPEVSSEVNTSEISGETQPITASSTEAIAPAKEFTIVGSNYAFAPSVMSVKKGDTVKIIFKNSGGFHDLKIDEFNLATQKIKDGEEETVTFTADKTGSFEYYCSVGNHRAMGMKGILTVE
jgi:nitrite reductase (NO-forming)